ncbi:unnamed protein product, partial [Bubo scandiacus]
EAEEVWATSGGKRRALRAKRRCEERSGHLRGRGGGPARGGERRRRLGEGEG